MKTTIMFCDDKLGLIEIPVSVGIPSNFHYAIHDEDSDGNFYHVYANKNNSEFVAIPLGGENA